MKNSIKWILGIVLIMVCLVTFCACNRGNAGDPINKPKETATPDVSTTPKPDITLPEDDFGSGTPTSSVSAESPSAQSTDAAVVTNKPVSTQTPASTEQTTATAQETVTPAPTNSSTPNKTATPVPTPTPTPTQTPKPSGGVLLPPDYL